MIEYLSPKATTRLALAITAILGTHCEPLLAADLSWNAPTDNWSDAANWSPATIPTPADNAIIDNGGTAQVTIPGAVAGGLIVGATNGNSGFLEILSGGTLDSTQGLIGRDAGATGALTVNGAGSLWRTTNFVTVGASGDGSLTIEGAGQVESLGGVIGESAGGTGTAVVTGVGSAWNNSGGAFLVGFGGDGALTIADGGQVNVGAFSVIGNSLGSSGSVTVNGDGSLWSTGSFSDLLVGAGGNGALTIENGGQVDSSGGGIGINSGVSGTVSVSGAGSLWRSSNFITIGASGNGSLTIEDSGRVESFGTTIGGNIGGTGTVTVSGAGSQWNNIQNVFVGAGGDGELTIADGGQVNNLSGVIGFAPSSSSTVSVTGAGSQWNNANQLFIGYDGDATLTITDGGRVDSFNSGIGVFSDSSAAVTVAGANSRLSQSGDITVGRGGDATLTITDGGRVDNGIGAVGLLSGSTGTVTVSGVGSRWDNSDLLAVGFEGDATLSIEDGGQVDSLTSVIGSGAGGSGTVIVTGSGSGMSSTGDLAVGIEGDGELTISNGGRVEAGAVTLAEQAGSGGTVTVSGGGSRLSSTGEIAVGIESDATLTIEDGGQVDSAFSVIGDGVGGIGTATVAGAGSTWDITSLLKVGLQGDGTLNITDGGQVIVTALGNTSIGDGTSSIGVVTVSGADSLLSSGNGLSIGDFGSGTLSIENGGRVDSLSGGIGFLGSGAVSVTGAGSQWNNAGNVRVGFVGDAVMTIADGGQVNNVDSAMAVGADSTATVLVTGGGSQWNSNGDLVIGNQGDATLRIADGGRVDNVTGAIGLSSGSTGEVVVTGAGSRWNSGNGLVVGLEGDATLTVENAGLVEASAVRLADQTGSSGTLNIGAGGAPGVLDTAEIIGGAGSATLNFTHTDSDYFFTRDGTVNGGPVVISGSTAVNHLGGGTTVLTGDHTYLGDTTIDRGTLLVNGAIDSASIINAGGTLGGDGTLAAVGFGGAGGTIAPGNSIGTLTVDAIDFAGGGVYEVEVDAAGNTDLLKVGGIASLAGGSLSVLPMPGNYGLETTYTILQAATVDGIFDEFSIAMSEFAFLDPSLVYTPNRVDLTLARNDVSFEAVAGTWNQRAVGSRIEQLYRNEPEAIQSLLDNLLPLSTEGVNAAYDSLSGVQHTHTQAIVGNLYRRFQSLLSDRLASGYITSASHDLSLSLSDERWARQLGFGLRSRSLLEQGRSVERGLWLRSFGGVGDIDATANASGADYTSAGVAVGVDAQLNNGVIVGVAAGYAHTDADTFGGSLDIDSYQVAGYAGWAHNDSYLNGSLGVGVHRSDASRRVVVGGFTGDAEADYDTLGMTAALEAGHHLYMNNAIRLTPFVGVAYTHLDRSDFTESGAGSANLTVGQESQELLRSKVGLRFEKTFATPGGVRITPMIETAYVREHLDSQNVISAGFANASDATFRIAGPDLDRNRIQLGASLGVWFSERSSLGIGYQAEFADSDDWHSLAATFRMRW